MMEQKATPLLRKTNNAQYFIRDYQPTDRKALIELANETLGKGYYLPDPNAGTIRVILENEQVIALCFSMQKEDSESNTFGMIKTLAVSPQAQRQGLAGTLLEDALHHFRNQGLAYAVYLAWRKSTGVLLRPKLERLGFQETAILKRNWYRSSREIGFDCPECGNPCICDAIWFEKRLL